jgi:hypothetical protein
LRRLPAIANLIPTSCYFPIALFQAAQRCTYIEDAGDAGCAFWLLGVLNGVIRLWQPLIEGCKCGDSSAI